jgi:hypothetical protein
MFFQQSSGRRGRGCGRRFPIGLDLYNLYTTYVFMFFFSNPLVEGAEAVGGGVLGAELFNVFKGK